MVYQAKSLGPDHKGDERMEMYKELTSLKIASTTKQLKTQTIIAALATALYSGALVLPLF